jgi:tetratricopeptide (TPR) repeat protein
MPTFSVSPCLRGLLFSCLLPAALSAQAGRPAFTEGMRLMQAGKFEDAEKRFERAISLERGVGEYHLQLGRAVGAQTPNASVVRQPFMARRIKSEFETAVRLDPSLIDAREGLMQFHLFAPGVMGGDPAEARKQQREIAARNAMRGHMAQAMLSWRDRDTVATERALRAAIAAAPDSAGPALGLAQRQASWGRTAAAFATLDGYLTRHPNHLAARYQFGRLAATTGEQLPRAETYLRAVVADQSWQPSQWLPSRAAAQARLGDVLRKQGKKEDARSAYTAALALDRDLSIAKEGLRALN